MTSPESVLRALADICGPSFARIAGPADAVGGRRARFVAAPGTTAAVVEMLRTAERHGLAVVPRGAGTKIDWGVPPAGVDLLLDTCRLAGIEHHHTDGLTAEIGAGTPVRTIQAALAHHGQRLGVDPPSRDATLGGVIATSESGPLRQSFGTAHDQVRQYSYVDAAGIAARADGVLVSANVRLQRLPQASRWVSCPVATPLQAHSVVVQAREAEVSASAIEVDLPASAWAGASERAPGAVAVLLEGESAGIGRRTARLATMLGPTAETTDVAPDWWGRYPFTSTDVALRLTVDSSDLFAAVYALRDAAGVAVPVRGSAGMGTVHAVLPGQLSPQQVEETLDAVRVVLLGRGGRCVVVAAPPAVRATIDMAGRDDLF